MLNLKSELIKKQKEISELRSQNVFVTKDVKVSNKKVPAWLKKNAGVNERNQKDLHEVIEEDKHAKVKAVLEAKSKMYDKMTSGEVIPNSDDSQIFLVDFEQKSIDAWRARSEADNKPNKPEIDVKMTSEVMKTIDEAKEQWVEYVDSLGRTRTCLQKDLAHYQKQDEKLRPQSSEMKDLMSDDMRREEERLKWEKSAVEDLQDELHYENLRFGEIRELGVGYYSFSGKQEEREEQMKRLDQLRRETVKLKQENIKKKQKQQSMLTTRLEKVRQRRIKQLKEQGKEIPASLLEPVELPPVATEAESVNSPIEPEVALASEQPSVSTKVREWDKGKDDWTPAKPPVAPRSWSDPRLERPSEFAPPSFYYSGDKRKSETTIQVPPPKVEKPEVVASNPADDDSERIQRLLAEVKSDANLSTKEQETGPTVEETPPTQLPYTPTDRPISIKVMSKPTKLLNSKSALNS